MNDPYIRTAKSIKQPPATFLRRLTHLGPGFILSAAIVGSGELIATTTLGAHAGFVTFWVVIVSCLLKVIIQIEVGKYTVLSGKTAMQIINELPGPMINRARWSSWFMLLLMFLKFLQMGGIVGGAAIIINMAFPSIDVVLACFIVVVIVAPPVIVGYYKVVESLSLIMISLFTVLTFAALYYLKYTPYDFSFQDVLSGLQFRLPQQSVLIAIAAFGITGVSGEEIIYYNYWCLEKGYARFAGPKEDTIEWERRAKGWIRTMKLDAVAAMIVYTAVTAAFYLLGASVLHARGDFPEDFRLIETLSSIYTTSLGPGVKVFFLIGAFMVLLSTTFSGLASWTRLFPDIFSQLGWLNFNDVKLRKRWVAVLAVVFPFCWALLYAFVKLPLLMVLSGGIVGAFILFIVAYTAIDIRFTKTEKAFTSGFAYDLLLCFSVMSIVFLGGYALWSLM